MQEKKRPSRSQPVFKAKASQSPTTLVLFNKPFNVLTQFTDQDNRVTLKDFIDIPDVYPAGRLDRDSEGLLLLTNNGQLQKRISHPNYRKEKEYWVQVEGQITREALIQLQQGVNLKDGLTRPAKATEIAPPAIWERDPPIRQRKHIPTSWISVVITEGKNRQIRRMTAHVGFPTLRLIRVRVDRWQLGELQPGKYILSSLGSA